MKTIRKYNETLTLLKSYLPKRTVVFQPPSFQGYVRLRGCNPFMASKSCYVFVRFCKPHSWHVPETGSQLLDEHHFTQNSSQERSRCHLLACVFLILQRSVGVWSAGGSGWWICFDSDWNDLVWCPGTKPINCYHNSNLDKFGMISCDHVNISKFHEQWDSATRANVAIFEPQNKDWLIDLWWFARLCYPL